MNMSKEKKHRVAIVGCGNVGRFAAHAILASKDLELVGMVRRPTSLHANVPPELASIPVVSSIEGLDHVEVACLAVPTRQVPKYAKEILNLGINTVDSYDIHHELVHVKKTLDSIARQKGSVAVISAGWDPGTDSLIRVILEIMAPLGITTINFGPGMSMGHTTAVKAIPGVKDAIAVTYPKGSGVHRRMVYVELDEGADFDMVREAIITDPYFSHDETVVMSTDNVRDLKDLGHGVMIERKGVAGISSNQRFKFEMSINNPAVTGQIMVGAARASLKQSPGAYTLPELPLIDFLHGDKDSLLARLV
jgi:diaminopimelate dehydrogenase